jgi:beta-glucosidase
MTPDPARLLLEALRLDREPDDAVRRRAYEALEAGAGGFCLFGGDAADVARLVEELRHAADRRIWVASDLERGAGQQFAGLSVFPPPAGLAAHPDAESAVRAAARRTGREARDVGVDLVLAPVLDLDVEPCNPIVGTRSFGADPDRVARLGRLWIEACQSEGPAACAKHFPGHGRTTADSHEELPVVAAPPAETEADLAPFRAVTGTVDAILTAHVAYPGLGANGPATHSAVLLRHLLRGDMGFDGLVVTDALNMAGVRTGGGEEPALAALRAGCDLLLYPEDLPAAAAALRAAADRDRSVGEAIGDSVARSASVAARVDARMGPARGRGAGAGEPDPAELAAACVRIDEPPPWLRRLRPVPVVTLWDDRDVPGRPPPGAEFARAMETRGVPTASAGPDGPALLLLASTPQAWKGTAGLTERARARVDAERRRRDLYVVCLGGPRPLEELGLPGLIAWGSEPALERAAGRRLAARLAPGGGR